MQEIRKYTPPGRRGDRGDAAAGAAREAEGRDKRGGAGGRGAPPPKSEGWKLPEKLGKNLAYHRWEKGVGEAPRKWGVRY